MNAIPEVLIDANNCAAIIERVSLSGSRRCRSINGYNLSAGHEIAVKDSRHPHSSLPICPELFIPGCECIDSAWDIERGHLATFEEVAMLMRIGRALVGSNYFSPNRDASRVGCVSESIRNIKCLKGK